MNGLPQQPSEGSSGNLFGTLQLISTIEQVCELLAREPDNQLDMVRQAQYCTRVLYSSIEYSTSTSTRVAYGHLLIMRFTELLESLVHLDISVECEVKCTHCQLSVQVK
jgi:hypothetical protein